MLKKVDGIFKFSITLEPGTLIFLQKVCCLLFSSAHGEAGHHNWRVEPKDSSLQRRR